MPIVFKKDALKEIRMFAEKYVPEWKYDEDDPDVGVVFSKIMEKLYSDTVVSFNRMPYNYYISFLNILGAKMASSVSAKGFVSVDVTDGTSGAYVDKGSKLNASGKSGSVTFETVESMYALDTRFKKVFFVDGNEDFISVVYDSEDDPRNKIEVPFSAFSKDKGNVQVHEIYICDPILFISKDKVSVDIVINDAKSKENNKFLTKFFGSDKNVEWSYYNGSVWQVIDEISVRRNTISLSINGAVKPCKILDKESRYIKCTVKIGTIPKSGVNLTDIKLSSKATDLSADITVCNSSELSERDYFPFGDELSTYTDFYIGSEEAFTKSKSDVSIDVEMQFVEAEVASSGSSESKIHYKSLMKRSDFEESEAETASILKVNWEYWNGLGWSKLYKDDTNEDFFNIVTGDVVNKTLTFKCPEDMEKTNIGPSESYFIRARIIKLRNPYNSFQKFITPYIHELKIGYDYKGTMIDCNSVVVNTNLTFKDIDIRGKSRKSILERSLQPEPIMYFCMTRAISEGPFKMLLDIEESLAKSFPTLRWEYYGENEKHELCWMPIQILDGTQDFKHSGIITFAGRSNFRTTNIFGSECYCIRAVNVDCEYRGMEDTEHPQINTVLTNTVPIIQRETVSPEYFSVDLLEENKKCKLFKNNVVDIRVWVNEIGDLDPEELSYFIENEDGDKIIVEQNEGIVSGVWIEWKEVQGLSSAGPKDRVFDVDYRFGVVSFGNNKHGKIPTSQDGNSIKIEYKISDGASGNVSKGSVNSFSDTITYVSNVSNLKSTTGGIDREMVEESAARVASNLAGMGKMVSTRDFENIICRNNRSIYAIKCVPHINYLQEKSPGTISIAVLPRHYMQGFEKFFSIKEEVVNYIKKNAPATMLANGKLDVFEVFYVEMSFSVEVAVSSYDYCREVYKDIENLLKELLDPVHGGFDKKGWKIGTVPSKEQIYNVIKSVKKVKWIKRVNIFAKVITTKGKKDIDFENESANIFSVPVCGDVDVDISVENTDFLTGR